VGVDRRGAHKIKIALVNNYLPFVYGGAEFLVDTLKDQLLVRGHEVSLTRIPFPATLDHKVINNILSCRCISFDDADKVIAFKFPAYFVRHSNKTLWMFHQLRQVYELWDSDYGLRHSPENANLRAVVLNSDNLFLREARHVFVNSKEVAGRLRRYNGINSEVLYPPLLDRERCYFREYGDFLFYPSRITSFKRQHLAIESMKHTKTDVRLVLAGKCDEPGYEDKLGELIDANGLGAKVTMLGWIEQQKKFDLMAGALACLYLPYQEDSYGFVSMEAFYSRKCVIALEDSGGTKELLEDGINGYVVPPTATALAEKFDALYENRRLARELGENAYTELTSRDISWDTVIGKLTQ
jgi:glycosyltransferase involved in cell wall biosynthesis